MKIKFLSANAIKIIAMVLMLLDHICLFFFPDIFFIRVICRISFPLFAYFIAEGCKYTKNKPKRFLIMFGLGVIFQVVYSGVVFNFKELGDLNILFTFSLSILLIYSLQAVKKHLLVNNKKAVLFFLVFLLVLAISILISIFFAIEYEIWGIIAPLLISIPDLSNTQFSSEIKESFDTTEKRLFFSAIAFMLLPINVSFFGLYELFGLFALPILYCYNGTRGKLNLKYLFYIFYPLHFVLIYAVDYLIKII